MHGIRKFDKGTKLHMNRMVIIKLENSREVSTFNSENKLIGFKKKQVYKIQ